MGLIIAVDSGLLLLRKQLYLSALVFSNRINRS